MSKPGDKLNKLAGNWRNVKASRGFRKMITYLVFVAIAALFWFILALNDNIQDDFEVKVNIINVPDSVTFIDQPPTRILVSVRDEGTSLWQNGVFARPTLDINFREHSADGVFKVNRRELNVALKNVFGPSASLISSSIDSLRLAYTNLPGKRVPILAVTDLSAASGKVIKGNPTLSPSYVLVYSTRDILDTINRVYTQKVTRNSLDEPTEITVKLKSIKGVRLEPESINLKIDVQPLVKKQTNVTIRKENVPANMDLLLFPANVKVEYFIPMSEFNRDNIRLDVKVDFRDLAEGRNTLPIRLGHCDKDLMNVVIMADSVEYTIVKK